jgi:hypothetical protein
MTREEYLQLRNSNVYGLIYEVYKERFDSSKHGQFYTFHEMIGYLQMLHGVERVANKIIQEYDVKFSVTYLLDKDGNKIGML